MWYIAGPMQYYPSFNFPMFERVTKILRGRGQPVLSPVELDDKETYDASMASKDGDIRGTRMAGKTWGDFLSRDVKYVSDKCDGIVMLPGWEDSRGARLELYVAMECGHDLYTWDDINEEVNHMPRWHARSIISARLAL